ncbi:FAD-binding oxidoreductase [Actinotalea fermentans]|uniref:Uncharacterized protein n=1 Tax=Actinotalea fermentans TaxID=43671 RepID=A0A511YVB2_9CELL|nr:hypothetical protein [Actinotalea fermentans]GEN79144.1 hypothetical protein AFE02nite_08780 [Actinotalea fermentans]
MGASVLDLPRSVTLAAWLPHVRGGTALAERAVAGVTDDDEPHAVVAHDGGWTPGSTLTDLLLAWGMPGVAVAAVLPVPGDVVGVPAQVSAAAVEAGECVLVETPTGAFAAVPDVRSFGSPAEPGHLVTWRVLPVPAWTLGVMAAIGSLADAERELREALRTATEALDRLDVARWREDAVAALASLRAEPDVRALPPGLEPRRARVLALAARLRVIVELASDDDGGAVNLWQADQRSAALRHVDHAARRAMCAATLVVPG